MKKRKRKNKKAKQMQKQKSKQMEKKTTFKKVMEVLKYVGKAFVISMKIWDSF